MVCNPVKMEKKGRNSHTVSLTTKTKEGKIHSAVIPRKGERGKNLQNRKQKGQGQVLWSLARGQKMDEGPSTKKGLKKIEGDPRSSDTRPIDQGKKRHMEEKRESYKSDLRIRVRPLNWQRACHV